MIFKLAKVKELAAQDPGAHPEPPFIIELEKKEVEEISPPIPPLAPSIPPSMTTLSALLDDIRYRVQLIGRERRLAIAVGTTRAWGIVAGMALALALLGILTLIALR